MSTRSPRQIIIQRRDEGFGFTLRHFIVYPPEVRVLFEKLIFRWTTFIENSVIFSHLKPPKKKNNNKQLLCARLARKQLFVIVFPRRLQFVRNSSVN